MTGRVTVLGSTGSIGTQTLQVMEHLGLRPAVLAAGSSVKILEEQARKFRPEAVCLADESAARDAAVRLADTDIKVLSGREGTVEAARWPSGAVVTAMVGTAGLAPTMAAIEAGRRICLANKETLVCAGRLVMKAAGEHGAEILPVDSEHSAIFQCLNAAPTPRSFKKLILTASGGPFFGKTRRELEKVTVEDALRHPNWSMGRKITVDSATMMNKGLEFIEAMHLFSASPEQIQVLVHRQSVVHSMIVTEDNAVIAQLGTADMRLPIQLALTWPRRVPGPAQEPDLISLSPLTFDEPDAEAFPALGLAMACAARQDAAAAVMNAANEQAVELFLQGKVKFLQIYDLTAAAVETITAGAEDLESILWADAEARRFVREKCEVL